MKSKKGAVADKQNPKPEFSLGSRVRITDKGWCFSRFSDMARSMGLKNWREEAPIDNGMEGTVFSIKFHPWAKGHPPYIGITLDNGSGIIMSQKGIVEIPKKPERKG